MMGRTLIFCVLGALGLGGCTLLFDDSVAEDKFDCMDDHDCPVGEYCSPFDRRCLVGERPAEPPLDEGSDLREAATSVLPRDDGPEPRTPRDMDVGTPVVDEGMGPGEGGPTDVYSPPFPDGACFQETGGRAEYYPGARGSTHVPYALCSPYGIVWTTPGPSEENQDGNGRVHVSHPPRLGPEHPYRYREGTTPLMFGSKLVLSRSNPDFDGATNLYWVDLATGQHDWLRPGGYTQSRPVRGDGFIGFIEAGAPGEGKVVFVREDLQAVVCPPESGARWGLGATGRSVAWLERPEGARRDRIVTVREIDPELTACPTSVRQRILTGEVDRDIGVHLTNTHALWFERSPALYVNRVHRWAFADPRAESPEIYRPPQSVSGVAVDMVTAGDVVVFVRYRPQPAPRYSFEFVPSGLATYVEPLADVRRPSLSPHYFMWAENQRNPAWEVRYARLP